jgi:hypothetical protein
MSSLKISLNIVKEIREMNIRSLNPFSEFRYSDSNSFKNFAFPSHLKRLKNRINLQFIKDKEIVFLKSIISSFKVFEIQSVLKHRFKTCLLKTLKVEICVTMDSNLNPIIYWSVIPLNEREMRRDTKKERQTDRQRARERERERARERARERDYNTLSSYLKALKNLVIIDIIGINAFKYYNLYQTIICVL